MHFVLQLICKHGKSMSARCRVSLRQLFAHPFSAMDLECDLTDIRSEISTHELPLFVSDTVSFSGKLRRLGRVVKPDENGNTISQSQIISIYETKN